jgi:DNA-binding transcriptional MerR regulator
MDNHISIPGVPGKEIWSEPMFSHSQALEVAQLAPETLLAWHQRGLVPESELPASGKGFRRRYSFNNIYYLALFNRIAASGQPLARTKLLTDHLFPLLQKANKLPLRQLLLVIQPISNRRPGAGSFELFFSKNPLPSGGIEEWMRLNKVEAVVLIDLVAFKHAFWRRLIPFLLATPQTGDRLRESAMAEFEAPDQPGETGSEQA